MPKPETCPVCNKGNYDHGSGLYDYYTCGHTYQKPLNSNENGKWIGYKSPYKHLLGKK